MPPTSFTIARLCFDFYVEALNISQPHRDVLNVKKKYAKVLER